MTDITVLDLIIQTIQEHEKKFDEQISKIEASIERLEEIICVTNK